MFQISGLSNIYRKIWNNDWHYKRDRAYYMWTMFRGEYMDKKNNQLQKKPKQEKNKEMTDDEKIDAAAARILQQYRKAFEELAK